MKVRSREQQIVHVSAMGVAANVALSASKAVVGLLSNSIAIILDSLNNLSDALCSIISLVGTRVASRPARREHPFGFGRFEYLTTLSIAIIILSTGIMSLVQSVRKIISPEPSTYTAVSVAVLLMAILAKLAMSRYFRRNGEKTKSDTLRVTAADAFLDAMITSATFVAALVEIIFGPVVPWLDGALGVIISLLIVRMGVNMVMSPLDKLVGVRGDTELVERLRSDISASDARILGVYDLILHDYGPGRKLGSAYIALEDTMTMHDFYDITRRIEQRVMSKYGIKLTIGAIAMNWKDPGTKIMYDRIMDLLLQTPGVIQIHGLYIDPVDKTISLDAVVDFSVKDRDAMRSELLRKVRECYPDFTTDVIIDLDYSTSG